MIKTQHLGLTVNYSYVRFSSVLRYYKVQILSHLFYFILMANLKDEKLQLMIIINLNILSKLPSKQSQIIINYLPKQNGTTNYQLPT